MKNEHIRIREVDEIVEVVVDDYELFDFIDDIFVENGVEYEFTSEAVRNGHRYYTMHFGAEVGAEQLSKVLDAIPQAEIERIWQLNHPVE